MPSLTAPLSRVLLMTLLCGAGSAIALAEETSEATPSEADLWAIPPSDTGAAEVDFGEREEATPPRFDWRRLERESSSDHVFIEHHGYFRFRADMHYKLDLGTYDASQLRGTSRILPPLSSRSNLPLLPDGSNQSVPQDSSSLASANIRFRYEPTVHIGEHLRVHTTLDLPDNLVLGSSPDGGPLSVSQRPDVPFDGLSDSQKALDGAVSLRYLWGVWDSELARLEFGRMRHHWGLGLLANGGGCLDCNFGDAIDRVQVTTQLFDIYLSLSWDLVAEGPTGYGLNVSPSGQPWRWDQRDQAWDWDQRDDVSQYSISLSQRALSPAELAQARADLKAGKLLFEWGVYGILRHQKNAAMYFINDSSVTGSPESPEFANATWTLVPTQLELFIPDIYLSWTYEPSASSHFELKAEGVGLFGSVDQVPLINANNDTPRDITSWGYALEFNAKLKGLLFGLHHGAASGDQDSGYFGAGPFEDPSHGDLTGFRFDRDYIVDLILFREVLGGVSNALYIKPYLGYELERRRDMRWGLRASAMYAQAMSPEYTAGNDPGLGLELDAEAYVLEVNRFRASLAYGVLFPLDGLNLLDTQRKTILRSAETAQTLQFNLGLMF